MRELVKSWLGRFTRPEQDAVLPAALEAGVASAADMTPPSPLQLYRAGITDTALQEAKARLAADPDDVESLYVQALASLAFGQPAAAITHLERIVGLQPDHALAWMELVQAHTATGRKAAAREALHQAQLLQPDHPRLLAEMAVLALSQGKSKEAVDLLAQIKGREPRAAEVLFQIGSPLLKAGKTAEALSHYQRALEHDPGHADAHANLGALYKDRSELPAALRHLEKAVALRPSHAQATYNLAMLRINRSEWASAAALLRQSLDADPKQADACYWLGNAVMGLGDADEARKTYQSALRLQSSYPSARWGFVMAQLPAVARDVQEQEEAPLAFARELDKLQAWLRTHRPANAQQSVGAQQPYYLAYIANNHKDVLGKYGQLCTSLMADWARKTGVPKPVGGGVGKIRVGIVSAHIHSHSVWHAILKGWIEHLDPLGFELHVFHTGNARDIETEWAARRVTRLHHALGPWATWAQAISDSHLDVLVYPEIGMDSTTVRLSCLRLAPVQVASWGHPVTTGLPTIDAYLSAEAFEPQDAQNHYTEKLVTLPRLGCAYRLYNTRPQVVDFNAWNIAKTDRVLLCAGNVFKYAPRDDQLLVEVARRCQPCKLLFFSAPGDFRATLFERRLRLAFESADLAFDDHVRFLPWLSQEQFFGLLQQADVFLDSAGFSGFNTAMQAVECGAPIVAWEGEFMRGRFASGILHQMGLDAWVANTVDGFASRVEMLCRDADLRRSVRAQIRAAAPALLNDKRTVDALALQLQKWARG